MTLTKEYTAEPNFITRRRERSDKIRATIMKEHDAKINQALAIAKRKPTQTRKGMKEHLSELGETLITGSPKDTLRVLNEIKEDITRRAV